MAWWCSVRRWSGALLVSWILLAACSPKSEPAPAESFTPMLNLVFDGWRIQQTAGACVDVLDEGGGSVLSTKLWCDVANAPLYGTNNLGLLGSDFEGSIYLWTDAPLDLVVVSGASGAFMSDKADLLVIYPEGSQPVSVSLAGRPQCEFRQLENRTPIADCHGVTPMSPTLGLFPQEPPETLG